MKASIMAVNSKREKVIDKLEEILKFFRHASIKNEDSLNNINKQLDNVMSSLKYVPSEPSFTSLPTEIKTDILNYLCDSGAFVAASVSQEWKQILGRNLKQVDEIRVGKHCSNGRECRDDACFMPEEFLKAAVTHNLDVPLVVCHPLRVVKLIANGSARVIGNIDTKLIAKGLASVSNLSISHYCYCNEDFDVPSIRSNEIEYLFKELEKRGKIMDSLQHIEVDLIGLNQIKLANYLLNKVKNLTVEESDVTVNGEMLDKEIFIKILSQILTNSQLRHLTIEHFQYPSSQKYPNLSKDLADAVCKVPSVELKSRPANREEKTARRLLKNIRTQNIRMKSFELGEAIDWRDILSPKKLKKTLKNMDKLKLAGHFTAAQVEAAKTLPGVEANFHKISKCSI